MNKERMEQIGKVLFTGEIENEQIISG